MSPAPADWIVRLVARYRHFGPFLLNAATLAAMASALWNFVILPLTGGFHGQMEDFDRGAGAQPGGDLMVGARRIAAGLDPYSPWLEAVKHGLLSTAGFDQPPLVGWLLQPLTKMSQTTRESVWLMVLLGALVAAAVIAARATLPAGWPRARLALIAVLVYPAATENLYHGNLNPIIFLLFAGALYAWVRGWEMRCAVILGIAAGLKLGPAVLVVLFIRRRWWRGIIAAAATAVALLLAGGLLVPGALQTFVGHVLPVLGGEDGWFANMSIAGAASRVFDHAVLTPYTVSAPLHAFVLLLEVVVVVATALVVRPGAAASDRRVAEFGMGVAAFLLVGATTWYRSHLHVLIVISCFVVAVTTAPPSRRLWLSILLAAVVVVDGIYAPLLLDALSNADITGLSRGSGWWPLLQVVSLPTLAVGAAWLALGSTLQWGKSREAPERATSPIA